MLLSVENLKAYYYTNEGIVKAVDGVNLELEKSQSLAVVGESGCGKTTLALSIPLLLKRPGRIVGGRIVFEEQNLLDMSDEALRKIRGARIGMIFQQPQAYLNPALRAGDQIAEVLETHQGLAHQAAKAESASLLKQVGIPSPEEAVNRYSFELSGGMAQRVIIAMALACAPSLIIADEPTSALDVTIQVQILETIRRLKEEYQTSLMLITHDLSLAAETCDRVAVMYAGKIVEVASIEKIFDDPQHPYTKLLLSSIPRVDSRSERLAEIFGVPPNLVRPPPGCRFHPRCPYAMSICKEEEPRLRDVKPDHNAACYLYG